MTVVERLLTAVLDRDCKTDVLSAIALNSEAVNAATEVLERFTKAELLRLVICVEDNAANCEVVRLLRTVDVTPCKAAVERLVTCAAVSVCNRAVLVAKAVISLLEIREPE